MTSRPPDGEYTVPCMKYYLGNRHQPHSLDLNGFGVEAWCPGFPIGFPNLQKAKVSVRKEKLKVGKGTFTMWVGRCSHCGYKTQYYNWGATIGAILYHQHLGCKEGSDGNS